MATPLSRLVLVLIAGIIACTAVRVHAVDHTNASIVSVSTTTTDVVLWAPLSQHHVEAFFKRPAFSLKPHLDAFHGHQHRRLQAQAREMRRLTAKECMADIKKWREKFKLDVSDPYGRLTGTLKNMDLGDIMRRLPELGASIRDFDFGKMGKVTVAGILLGATALIETFTLAADVRGMMEEARAVIDTIRKVEEVVRRIGSEVLELLEKSDFDHFISKARASASTVLDDSVDTSEELLAVCRGFDYSQITALSTTMQSFQICTRETEIEKLKKCQLSLGIAAAGTLVLSLSAASLCDAHVAISQSNSAHPMSALKMEAEKFIMSVMSTMLPSNTSDPTYKESNDILQEYKKNVTDIAALAVPADDPDSSDSYVRDALADLHARTFRNITQIQKYTASALYGNMTALNPDAGAAGAMVALAMGKSQTQVVGKLNSLQDKVLDQHDERMGLYDKIDTTLWDNHGAFMGQVDHMSTAFTEQHSERMGRLQGVQSSLGNIQSSTTSGFATLRGRITDMGRKFVSQVQGIESSVVSTGAETTSYLSNAVLDANREIENRINGVGETVVRSHEMVMSAIGDAQNTAVNEFTATQNALYTSSDALRQTIDNGLGAVADAASKSFHMINDVVYKRMEESHSILEQLLSGMSSDFALIDDKLVILENKSANISRQMDVAKEFLVEIHLRFDQIQQMLDNLPAVVQQEMFQSDVDGLHRTYQNMRKVYRDYLDSELPVKTIAESCASFRIYDLFLKFLRIVDISDQELPRQLENFDYDNVRYEQFGVLVVGVLNDLSFFDGVCAKAQFSATLKDLEVKAKEQADLILAATAKLARHVEELIPVLVLERRVQKRMAQVSELAWDVEGETTIEKLRLEFQAALGDFAYVTVLHAGTSGQLIIDHLDRTNGAMMADGMPRKSGVIVSSDQKLAVMWSQTRRISNDKMTAINQTELLRQGVYRGNLTSTSQSCLLAASSNDYYPSCDKCSCIHFEGFASLSDPMGGRAVTYLADKTYDADFVVETVATTGANYLLHVIQLNLGSLAPSSLATAQLQAPVVISSTPRQSDATATPTTKTVMRTLWEGTSSIGRFDVVPSGIKGTLLAANELTLSVTHGSKQLRHTFSLFCDGFVKRTALPDSDLQLQYACSEVPHQAASAEIVKQGYAFVSSGLPTKRYDRAVCVESGTRRACKVTGAVDAIGDASQFVFGTQVERVTLFTEKGFRGPFMICKGCSTKTLSELTTTYVLKTVYIGVPDAPPEMAQVECAEAKVPSPEMLLLCRPMTDGTT